MLVREIQTKSGTLKNYVWNWVSRWEILTTPLRADFSSVWSDIIITNTASQAQMHTDRKWQYKSAACPFRHDIRQQVRMTSETETEGKK